MAAAGDGEQASGALEVVDLLSEDDHNSHCFRYCCHCCWRLAHCEDMVVGSLGGMQDDACLVVVVVQEARRKMRRRAVPERQQHRLSTEAMTAGRRRMGDHDGLTGAAETDEAQLDAAGGDAGASMDVGVGRAATVKGDGGDGKPAGAWKELRARLGYPWRAKNSSRARCRSRDEETTALEGGCDLVPRSR